MSVWLWSIAVTGVLTAGTCPMSSIVVRSCWELQRGPWWPAQDKATSEALGHLGYKGSVQAERSGGGGDGERLMAEAARG